MTTTAPQTGTDVYGRFLRAFNDGDYGEIDKVISPDFTDHHPGFSNDGLEAYKDVLRESRDTLRLNARALEVIETGDRVITHCELSGVHTGTVMGVPGTGRPVTWETIEIWRVEDGCLAERWAQDDLLGLREQISPDAANVALIRRLNDCVNERRFDDMDELFAESFTDHNPAWSVQSLDELKEIIGAAVTGLDFHSHHDLIYPAEGGKVIIHITFTGQHVQPFLDQEPTGNKVQWTSVEIYRIEHDKIVERWVQADTTGLMRQLGVQLPG